MCGAHVGLYHKWFFCVFWDIQLIYQLISSKWHSTNMIVVHIVCPNKLVSHDLNKEISIYVLLNLLSEETVELFVLVNSEIMLFFLRSVNSYWIHLNFKFEMQTVLRRICIRRMNDRIYSHIWSDVVKILENAANTFRYIVLRRSSWDISQISSGFFFSKFISFHIFIY